MNYEPNGACGAKWLWGINGTFFGTKGLLGHNETCVFRTSCAKMYLVAKTDSLSPKWTFGQTDYWQMWLMCPNDIHIERHRFRRMDSFWEKPSAWQVCGSRVSIPNHLIEKWFWTSKRCTAALGKQPNPRRRTQPTRWDLERGNVLPRTAGADGRFESSRGVLGQEDGFSLAEHSEERENWKFERNKKRN